MYADTREGAAQLVAENADGALAFTVKALVDNEQARWIPDPEVVNVWGLQASNGEILLVAYVAEDDFEISEAGSYVLPL